MAKPEVTEKLRLMQHAIDFPILTFIDTPSIRWFEAEEQCQGEAIARNHGDVWLKFLIVATVIGEGGSGGALGIGVADGY